MKMLLMIIVLLFTMPAYAAPPLIIGVTQGFSGKYAEMSAMQIKSLRLWEEDINARGGMLGRKVNLIIYDDKGDPQVARQLYQQMINRDRVDLLLAPYSSELTEAVADITEKNRYPLITSGASADHIWQKGHQYIFGLYTVASRYAVGFLEMAVRHNLNDIAIISSNDNFSQSVARGASQWSERFGIKISTYLEFEKGTKDFAGIIRQIRSKGAKAVMVCGHFDEAVAVRTAIRKSGWQPHAYYASVGPVLSSYQSNLGRISELTFTTSQWEPSRKIPGAEKFYNSFRKTYKTAPSYQAANAYAACQVLEKAIRKSNSFDRVKIRDTLSSMSTTSIIGMYGVDRHGRQSRHLSMIIQWQNGKKEIVWPAAYRTARPIFQGGAAK